MDEFKVNEPQATAILKAINTEGFSLIQGLVMLVSLRVHGINN